MEIEASNIFEKLNTAVGLLERTVAVLEQREALMSGELRSFEAEGVGDDVPAARQDALSALCELAGALSEGEVEFVTVSEGERGLMGVGRQPARVLARAQVAAAGLGPVAERVREVVEHIAAAIDPELAVTVTERDMRDMRVVAVASGERTTSVSPLPAFCAYGM